jgi:AraC-like DNA-binding protein
MALASADNFFGVRPFSTEQVPGAHGFPLWSRLLSRWLLDSEARSLAEGPFHASARLRVLSDIRFGWGEIGPSVYERGRNVVTRDNDDLMLIMNLGGRFLASHAQREFELAPGQSYVMGCTELGSHVRPDGGSLLCVRVSRSAMLPMVRNLDDRFGSVIPREQESMRLLSAYLHAIDDTPEFASDAIQRLATRHVHDLLALALGSAGDARAAAREGGLRAARLKAAKALVRRHLADHRLSAELVARHLQISARSVQRLFEAEGTRFSDFVTAERLASAYHVLATTGRRDLSIANVALNCGFGDVSYFNRKFRDRYHATPSDVRYSQAAPTTDRIARGQTSRETAGGLGVTSRRR